MKNSNLVLSKVCKCRHNTKLFRHYTSLICVEFKTWKENYERASNSWFVQEKTAGLYYYCNRSGNFQSKSTGKRHLKNQGTSKLNAYCTASVTVKVKSAKCLKVKHTMGMRHPWGT